MNAGVVRRRRRSEEDADDVKFAQDKSRNKEWFDQIPAHSAAKFEAKEAKCKAGYCLGASVAWPIMESIPSFESLGGAETNRIRGRFVITNVQRSFLW